MESLVDAVESTAADAFRHHVQELQASTDPAMLEQVVSCFNKANKPKQRSSPFAASTGTAKPKT